MIFLNTVMLLGLAGVAVPVVIHLLNRNKARPVEWGAMRFLLASLAARSRRMLLEEMILLALRCMLVLMLVMVLARPFLPGSSSIPWLIVFPLIAAAVVCAGISASVWKDRRLRVRLLKTAAVLACIGILAAALEKWLQLKAWSGDTAQDVVVIVDSSSSMSVKVNGRSNYEQAVEEAVKIIEGCNRQDGVSVVLAGAVPGVLFREPQSDHAKVQAALKEHAVLPSGGTMSVLDAVNAAAAVLEEGKNPGKQIVLVTDGQSAGWSGTEEAKWQYLSSVFDSFATRPRVICRKLELPDLFRNAMVGGITVSRPVIGTDRPVRIDVKVSNTGKSAIQPAYTELFVDGKSVERDEFVKELLAGVSEVISFEYRFDKPGNHVVEARLNVEDDMDGDNSYTVAVQVIDKLPVLVVDGNPSSRLLKSAGGLTLAALSPDAAAGAVDSAQPASAAVSSIIGPEMLPVTQPGGLLDLGRYRALILADVPGLPGREAQAVADFVKNGGGLFVMNGRQSSPEFYNGWQTKAGEVVLPALMGQRVAVAREPERINMESLKHPSVKLVGESSQSDMSKALVYAYWQLASNERSGGMSIGSLSGGIPFLALGRLGRGRIIQSGILFDVNDSNLPALKSFVPALHEIVLFLAEPGVTELNIEPGRELIVRLDKGVIPDVILKSAAAVSPGVDIEVAAPSGADKTGKIFKADGGWLLRCSDTQEPGLYRVYLNGEDRAAGEKVFLHFTVKGSEEESFMRRLEDVDLVLARKHIEIFNAERLDDVLTAIHGHVPGHELWRVMGFVCLLVIIAETGLSRWIAMQRRYNSDDTVELKSASSDLREFRRRAMEVLSSRGGRGG